VPILSRLFLGLAKVRKLLLIDWRFLLLAVVLHYALSWWVYALTEAPDSNLIKPANYWYYWWTTSLTIGYGDLSPQSDAARLIAPIIMATGVGLITLILGKVIAAVTDFIEKRRKGLMPTDATGHILVLGDYHPFQTRALIANAVKERQDDHWDTLPTVVGCFSNTGDRNPFTRASDYHGVLPEYVQAAEGGINRKTIEDAGATRASQIYVSAVEDARAIGIICLLSQFRPTARVVLLLREQESAELVPDCALELSIITPMQALVATREMADPGTASAIVELLEPGGNSFFSLRRPENAPAKSFEDIKQCFDRRFGGTAILLGISQKNGRGDVTKLNPPPTTLVSAGDGLLYIAEHDLSPQEEQELHAAVAA